VLIYLSTIAGFVIWVVLWAIGVTSFDALMIFLAIVLLAVCWRAIAPYLPGNRRPREE